MLINWLHFLWTRHKPRVETAFPELVNSMILELRQVDTITKDIELLTSVRNSELVSYTLTKVRAVRPDSREGLPNTTLKAATRDP